MSAPTTDVRTGVAMQDHVAGPDVPELSAAWGRFADACHALHDACSEVRAAMSALKEADKAATVAKISPLGDDYIDAVANGMPGGMDGFLKGWGWRQFAREIEASHGIC